MTIMQAVLFPPLDDDDSDETNSQRPLVSDAIDLSNIDGGGCPASTFDVANSRTFSCMSPDLQARFESLKRWRSDDNEEINGPICRRRVELATETALLAQAEINRMHQAVAELENLLNSNDAGRHDVVDVNAVLEEDEALTEDEVEENDERLQNGRPAAIISFPRLPHIVSTNEHNLPPATISTFTSSHASVHVKNEDKS